MKKIGSEFLKEFGNEEKELAFGFTGRMLFFLFCLVVTVGLSIGIVLLGLPDWYMYLLAGLVLVPSAMYGLGMTKSLQLKDKIRFFFTIQDRGYETDYQKGEKYSKDEFVQNKKSKTRKGRKAAA
ncbi:hypothetical protein STRDD10_00419 [Streptococcus sp. DD10]|uniref:PrgI family protein n=1 Tax=Streptococcus sp. DD10 TaxID=1777878 RepID=UPI00079575A6|nr:PrgI family protein [Streptococcus sp. DD10]KXT75183.1 hypothetical protein STRDD10_00419 [Streptococcus sp. DD10]